MTKWEIVAVTISVSNALWFHRVYRKLMDKVQWELGGFIWQVKQLEKKIMGEKNEKV